MKTYDIVIRLADKREMRFRLDTSYAPVTVEHFVEVARKGHYEGAIFHRVIRDFMIQTGGYRIKDMTLEELESVESIKGEFRSNGVENTLKHTLGVISMARTSDPDSASDQFFICAADTPHLDGQYAAFGYALDEETKQVVLDIAAVQTGVLGYGFTDFPYEPIVIESVEVVE